MPAQGPTRHAVEQQTERILSSPSLAAAERSRALLRFVVEHTLDGHSARLKEYTLGSEALGRGEAFDPRTDPIVRAEASRLRGRLERYYATEGASDDVLIVLPKGSYAPRFENRGETRASSVLASRGIRPVSAVLDKLVWFAAGGVTIGAVAALLIRSPVREALPQERIVPLTALPGTVWWPTLSPDGRQVAFVWSGDEPGRPGIYVKMVGTSEVRRLVEGLPQPPANAPAGSPLQGVSLDFAPQWSPDGLQIAFVRSDVNAGRKSDRSAG